MGNTKKKSEVTTQSKSHLTDQITLAAADSDACHALELEREYSEYLYWITNTVRANLQRRFANNAMHRDLADKKVSILHNNLASAQDRARYLKTYQEKKLIPEFNKKVEDEIFQAVKDELGAPTAQKKQKKAKKTWTAYKRSLPRVLFLAGLFTFAVTVGAGAAAAYVVGLAATPFILAAAGIGLAAAAAVCTLYFTIATVIALVARHRQKKYSDKIEKIQARVAQDIPEVYMPSNYIFEPNDAVQPNLGPRNLKIKQNRWYENEDIDTVMLAHIKSLGGYWHKPAGVNDDGIEEALFEFNHFLIKNRARPDGKFADQIVQAREKEVTKKNENFYYYSAYTPAVDLITENEMGENFGSQGGMPVHFYLNKNDSTIAQRFMSVPSEFAAPLPDRKDVFDELLPEMHEDLWPSEAGVSARAVSRARINFPLRIESDHWVGAEIRLKVTRKSVNIEFEFNDPFGRDLTKVLDEADLCVKLFSQLQHRIENDPLFQDKQLTFSCRDKPYLSDNQRQCDGDEASCGVITSRDLMLRLEGKTISRDQPYPSGAIELRKSQLELVHQQFGINPLTGLGCEGVLGKGFFARNTASPKNKPEKAVPSATPELKKVVNSTPATAETTPAPTTKKKKKKSVNSESPFFAATLQPRTESAASSNNRKSVSL